MQIGGILSTISPGGRFWIFFSEMEKNRIFLITLEMFFVVCFLCCHYFFNYLLSLTAHPPPTLANSAYSSVPHRQLLAPTPQPIIPATQGFSIEHTCSRTEFSSLWVQLQKSFLLQHVVHWITCVMSQFSLGPVLCVLLMLVCVTCNATLTISSIRAVI